MAYCFSQGLELIGGFAYSVKSTPARSGDAIAMVAIKATTREAWDCILWFCCVITSVVSGKKWEDENLEF